MKQSVAGIVRKNDLFLLGLRCSGGSIGSLWEFPGGKCEQGETAQQALIREYHEELAVPVSVGSFIGSALFHKGEREFKLLAYEVHMPDTATPELSVHTKLQWFSFDELKCLTLVPSDKLLIPALQTFYQLP